MKKSFVKDSLLFNSTNFWIQDIDLWPNTNHLKGTGEEYNKTMQIKRIIS